MSASAVGARRTRERRLRERIDVLADERERLAAKAARLERRLQTPKARTRCVYCGERCRGRTCGDHRDLPRLDPHYEGTG